MPLYPFICYDCNEKNEIFKARMESPKTPICPKCKKKMARVFSSVVDATMIENVRYSYAMAVSPNQVEEAMRVYPGSKYVIKDDSIALLEVRGRQHKKFEMKRRGMAENA